MHIMGSLKIRKFLTLGPKTFFPTGIGVGISKLSERHGTGQSGTYRSMRVYSQSSTAMLRQPVKWVDFRPECSLDSLSTKTNTSPTSDYQSQSMQPFAIRGAMQEGWPVLQWTHQDLLDRCGDCEVPVEVSSGGGDYRDLYSDSRPSPGRSFEAGVPVPLSLLLSSMQESEVRWQPETCLSVHPCYTNLSGHTA